MRALLRGIQSPNVKLQSRLKYTLAFKHDPEKQSLIFYTRDPPLECSRLFQDTFEDMYLDTRGWKWLPTVRFQRHLSTRPPLPVPDYRRLDPNIVVSILQRMGRMPRRREFTVCAIGKLFHDHQAYTLNFFDDVSNDVRLKPGLLFSNLLHQRFEEDGEMDLNTFCSLKLKLAENLFVRHGIEVDLRFVPGMGEKRYVIFPRRINKREIKRCLAMSGIRMRLMRVRILRPNPKSTAMPWLKRLPTRCIVFPPGTKRTKPKQLSFIRPRKYHPIRKRMRRRNRSYRFEKPID